MRGELRRPMFRIGYLEGYLDAHATEASANGGSCPGPTKPMFALLVAPSWQPDYSRQHWTWPAQLVGNWPAWRN